MKDKIWQTIKDEVTLRIEAEPSLKPYLETLVISKKSLISSVAAILSSKLNSDALKSSDINDFILDVYENCDGIEDDIVKDLLSGEFTVELYCCTPKNIKRPSPT